MIQTFAHVLRLKKAPSVFSNGLQKVTRVVIDFKNISLFLFYKL